LLDAYATASQLRSAGLEFVVAPIVTGAGAVAERIDERHSLSVFEHVVGQSGQWGQSLENGTRSDLVTMLARLHQSPANSQTITERPFVVPDRDGFEAALEDVHRPWTGGPLSEAARHELLSHVDVVSSLFDEVDRFAGMTNSSGNRLLVTHGEPHPGNLIRTAEGLAMVDWDTVALAPPERDLWMLADDGSLIADYERLTGLAVDRRALTAHRLMWSLTDLAAYTLQLRDEHQEGADSDRALAAVCSILAGKQPTPYGCVNPPPYPG
jgi:spectinomycin phosphotransferase